MNDKERHVSIRQVNILVAIVAVLFALNHAMNFITAVTDQQRDAIINVVMAIGSIAAVGLTMANFELSIILFIFVSPLVIYNIPELDFYFTYGDAYLIILVFVSLSRMALGRENRPMKTILDRLIFFFILLTVLSAINSVDGNKAVKEIVQTFEYFVFCYFLFTIVVKRKKMLDTILYSIVMCGAMIAAYGIMQYFGLKGDEQRIHGTFGHFNAMGTFMAMMVVFAFNMALNEQNRWRKLTTYGALALDTVALLMTFSRGAWIGVVVGLVLSAQVRGMVQFIRIFTVVMVALIFIALVAPPRYLGRMASVPRVEDSASKSRIRQWQIAMETMSDYPLLGVGLESNGTHVAEKYGEPENGEIHNVFLHIASERGVPAMIVLILIFVVPVLDIAKRIKRTEDTFYSSIYVALFSAIITFGVVNIFAFQLIRGLAIFFMMFQGLYHSTKYIEENEPVESKWAEMLTSLDNKRPQIRLGM